MDKDDEILVLVFDEPLAVGEGILRIIFYGKLNEHTKGLYKWCCDYCYIIIIKKLIFR